MLLRKKQHKERFHPATKLLYWLALLVVISTSNNHLVYAVYIGTDPAGPQRTAGSERRWQAG